MKTKIALMLVLIGFTHLTILAQSQTNNTVSETYQLNPAGFASDRYESDFSAKEVYYNLSRRLMVNEIVSETLAAGQDTNGNWGEPINGFQSSIRFRQHEFLSNQPVMAIIILRNLNSTPQTITISDYMWQFILQHDTNTYAWAKAANIDKRDSREDNGVFGYTLKPGSEVELVAHLNRFFNLSRVGDYSVQVAMSIGDDNGKTNIFSGFAAFQIVNKFSPAEVIEIDSYNQHVNSVISEASKH